VFARLFAQLNLPASELDLMQQALRRASAGTGEGASGQSPLMPQRAEDLHWLGLLPATVAALRPHLTVLPGRLPVNLNTADAVVLQAVLGGGPVAMDALLARRKAQPLGSLADAGLGGPGGPAASDQLSVNSNFFEVQTSVQLGSSFRLGQRALLQARGAGGSAAELEALQRSHEQLRQRLLEVEGQVLTSVADALRPHAGAISEAAAWVTELDLRLAKCLLRRAWKGCWPEPAATLAVAEGWHPVVAARLGLIDSISMAFALKVRLRPIAEVVSSPGPVGAG
jgi:hypothetical protein